MSQKLTDAEHFTPWIGVDLDGTLAQYDTWRGPEHIGEPIEPMVGRVRWWVEHGVVVKVFTARAFNATPEDITRIQDWTQKHIGHRLEVTCTKDYGMMSLWDDRAVRVQLNMGLPCCNHHVGKG